VNPSQTVETTLWITLLLQTLGAVDAPGKGPRKLPAPRAYAAVLIVWTSLAFMADSGPVGARAARSMSWLLVLVTLVLGPSGKILTGFLAAAARDYGTTPLSGRTVPAASASSSPGGTVGGIPGISAPVLGTNTTSYTSTTV
jgi:hypothetical protein